MLTPEEQEQFARLLFKLTNGAERHGENVIYDTITNLHPTLQQVYWRMHKHVIFRYADLPDHYFDVRNRASQEWCKRVAGEHEGRPNFVSLPTI